MEDGKMKILYEDNHLLVVVKPVNVPVCEDESKDESISDEPKSRNYWINEDNVIIAPCNIKCPYQLGFGYDQTITCTL